MQSPGTIRSLTRNDREAVIRLCDQAMPNDFVPSYFDSFIKKDTGFAFEMAGEIVGIILASRVSNSEGWLFGLRVAPDERRKGIGRALTSHAIEALTPFCHIVRVGIFPDNRASLHLARSLGFSPCAGYIFRVFQGDPPSSSEPSLRLAITNECDEILSTLSKDRSLRRNKLLIPRSFEWCALSKETLENLIQNGCVWRTGEQLGIVSIDKESARWIEIDYLSRPFDRILPSLLYRFANQGTVEAALPAHVGFAAKLKKYGFVVPQWGSRITILERPLSYPPHKEGPRGVNDPP